MLAARRISPIFARDGNGKPVLQNSALHFNLSHSGDFVACAVYDSPVGIDIEALRDISPTALKRICTAQEQAYICADNSFDSARFLQVWTAKEAYLKYLGCGLRGDMRKIEVVRCGVPTLESRFLHTALTAEYALSVVY